MITLAQRDKEQLNSHRSPRSGPPRIHAPCRSCKRPDLTHPPVSSATGQLDDSHTTRQTGRHISASRVASRPLHGCLFCPCARFNCPVVVASLRDARRRPKTPERWCSTRCRSLSSMPQSRAAIGEPAGVWCVRVADGRRDSPDEAISCMQRGGDLQEPPTVPRDTRASRHCPRPWLALLDTGMGLLINLTLRWIAKQDLLDSCLLQSQFAVLLRENRMCSCCEPGIKASSSRP
jgi:hypothetical protein